jgi:hypothetical protein
LVSRYQPVSLALLVIGLGAEERRDDRRVLALVRVEVRLDALAVGRAERPDDEVGALKRLSAVTSPAPAARGAGPGMTMIGSPLASFCSRNFCRAVASEEICSALPAPLM